MFKKIKRFILKKRLKQILYQSLELGDLELVQVDGLYTLLSCFIERNGVRSLVRLLDEETYLSLWHLLLEHQKNYPFRFEVDEDDFDDDVVDEEDEDECN